MNESDIELENEIFKMIYPLDREIFMLFCKIDRYKDKMIEPLYQYMAKMHFLLYKNEMEKATEKYLMDRKKERYEYESRDSIFAPEKRGIFHRRNKAAKLIDKKVLQDWDEYFEEAKKLLYKVADEVAEENKSAKDPEQTTGVNDLSDQVEPCNVAKTPPDLPITTLQACDELVKYAPPIPQKAPKKETRGVDAKPKAPKQGRSKQNERKEIPKRASAKGFTSTRN